MPGVCGFITTVFIHAAFTSFGGFLTFLVGHAVLRAAHLSPFNDPQYSLNSSMKVGALGGTLMAIPMIIIVNLLGRIKLPEEPVKQDEEAAAGTANADDGAAPAKKDDAEAAAKTKDDPNFGLAGVQLAKNHPLAKPMLLLQLILSMAAAVGFGAGTGVVGTAILRASQKNYSFLPPLYAARAGAVGSAILGPGVMTLILILTACCSGMIGGGFLLANRKAKAAAEANKAKDADKPNQEEAKGAKEANNEEEKPNEEEKKEKSEA